MNNSEITPVVPTGEVFDPTVAELAPQLLPLDAEHVSLLGRMRNRFHNTWDGIKDVSANAKTDFVESDSRMTMIAAGAGAIATQVADRLRISVVFVPEIAVQVLKDTNSPIEAGLAAGAAFAGWCAIVGGATTEALDKYPKAVDAFSKDFPGVVDFFQDALPGIGKAESTEPEHEAKHTRTIDVNTSTPDEEKTSEHEPQHAAKPRLVGKAARKIGSEALTHTRRGLTVTGIGSVAYVSTAAVQGRGRKNIHGLNANASIDGGIMAGGIVTGIGYTIKEIATHDPLLALRIENDASNIYVWYCVAGAMIVTQFVANRMPAISRFATKQLQKFHALRHKQDTLEVEQPAAETQENL